ncbi:hypothetical protein LMH73_015865 [Vibrio splendidus]|nr:hypothetical protein [Vibrio splendidus]MCC4881459.1 hypothetical protein [Vibrio splendidus]
MFGRKISVSLIEEYLLLNIKEKRAFTDNEILAYYTSGMDFITGFDVSYVIDAGHEGIFSILAEAITEFHNLGCKPSVAFDIEGYSVEFVRTPKDRFINTFTTGDKQHHLDNDIGYFQILIKSK